MPFPAVLLLFVAFIVCCGMTHLAEAAMFWWPAYRLMGLVKVVTAIVSLTTVVALVHFVPRMLLLRSPEQLEREVTARTAELDLARQQAQGAAEARARFTANVSHELRTPMAAMLGYADVLAADPQLGDAQRQHVRVIQRNGHHLLSIINDVLDLARSEAGKLPLTLEPCRVETIVRECVEMLGERASSKGLALEAELPAEPLPLLWLDPVRVRQILINLLGNAIKFTSRGRVGVALRAQPIDECRLQLEFDVRDTGIGMTPEQAERAFDEFTQADGSLTRRYGGSGLGLTLSRRLATAMQGTLSIVATAPDAGTTVRFVLPATPAPESAATRADDAAPPRLDGCRVLVAEDAPDTALLVQNVLTAAGVEVACVRDGGAATTAVLAATDANAPFHAVLMDVQMPGVDGLTATRMLRARGLGVPIVAFTAHAGDEARDESLRAGCTAHLTKPVRPRDLLHALATVLGRTNGAAAHHGAAAARPPRADGR